jgi:hypothetical protein
MLSQFHESSFLMYRGISPVSSVCLDLVTQQHLYSQHMLSLLTGKPTIDTSPVSTAPRLKIHEKHDTRDQKLKKQNEDVNLAFAKPFHRTHDHSQRERLERTKRPVSESGLIEDILKVLRFHGRPFRVQCQLISFRSSQA